MLAPRLVFLLFIFVFKLPTPYAAGLHSAPSNENSHSNLDAILRNNEGGSVSNGKVGKHGQVGRNAKTDMFHETEMALASKFATKGKQVWRFDNNQPPASDATEIRGDDTHIEHRDNVLRVKTQARLSRREKNEKSAIGENMETNMQQQAKCRIYQTIANCSNLGLRSVPNKLPQDITELILSHNSLRNSSLIQGPFRKYSELVFLNLADNNISSLPDDAFKGLTKLTNLSLHNNSLTYDMNLNLSRAFLPLKHSLKTLIMNKNNEAISMWSSLIFVYPDKALSYLENLQYLAIDGLPGTAFGFHFRKLKKLKELQMAGYKTGTCQVGHFRNETFVNVPSVENLNISDCNIERKKLENSVLEPLQNLTSLDISYNFGLGLDGVGDLMYGQRNNERLKYFQMNIIGRRYAPCVVVYPEHLRYFKNLHLERLDATHNNIEMIAPGALGNLPETLTHVNLKVNKIMLGEYWKDLTKLKNLQYLYLDGYDIAYSLPKRLPEHLHCNTTVHPNVPPNKESVSSDDHLKLSLPPRLERVSLRSYGMSYKITQIDFAPENNTLWDVDLHGNFFSHLIGPIFGLDSLTHLDLSSCSVFTIADNFFSHFKSLKKLNLYGNYLGDSLSTKQESTPFASGSLEKLDLGMNNIFNLGKNIFHHCKNLTTLILYSNKISEIEFSMADLQSLQRLNLSNNNINSLPKSVMDHFDKMKKSHRHVYIDMANNPIICDCGSIPFLKWVTRTKIFGDDYKNYYCFNPSLQSRRPMNYGYDEELKMLIDQCADNRQLFVCVISASLAFIIILIGVVIYRFRWTMRYWFIGVKLLIGKKSDNARQEYEYDVFVCYCRQDQSFVMNDLEANLGTERGMKLLRHDKCFQAGAKISENILSAVGDCRKTLVVMTKAMLDSAWCNYELEMARQEAISTGRNVLVILFLEKIPMSTMTLDMVNYIRSNVIVTYPSDPEQQEVFWNKLAEDLKSS